MTVDLDDRSVTVEDHPLTAAFWFQTAWLWARHTFRSNLRLFIALFFDIAFGPLYLIVASTFATKIYPGAAQFLTVGMAFYPLLATALVSLPQQVVGQKELHLLQRVRATPIAGSAVAVGFVLGSGLTALISTVLVFVVGRLVLHVSAPHHALAALGVWVLALLTLSAGGLLMAVPLNRMQAAIAVLLPALFISMGLGQIFFPVQLGPRTLRDASWILPVRPLSDWFRAEVVGQALPHAFEPWLAIGWLVVLGILAVKWFRWD